MFRRRQTHGILGIRKIYILKGKDNSLGFSVG